MTDKSPIEWTDATWNPIVGCSIVSPGCTNCYAMRQAARIEAMAAGARTETHYSGTTKRVNGKPIWTGKLALAPKSILHQPLRWKRPRRIFVNSMGDLFHEDVPNDWIDHVFAVMALSPQHTFQVLTKRSDRMRDYCNGDWSLRIIDRLPGHIAGWLSDGRNILPNVWLGVSAERQQEADERIPDLLATPAAVRFVSVEPLLRPLNIAEYMHDSSCEAPDGDICTCCEPREIYLDWVIVGGESGPDARPMHRDWARSIRDQCAAANVAFFFKQWGGRNKKTAGRLLDGVEHNAMPSAEGGKGDCPSALMGRPAGATAAKGGDTSREAKQ